MTRRYDDDLKAMSVWQLRREVMKLRTGIAKHGKVEGNARCWKNDLELYGLIPAFYNLLSERDVLCGKMDIPKEELLVNCEHYIDGQQCFLHGHKKHGRRKNRKA